METNPKPTALFLLVPWSCADTEQATRTGLSRGKHSVYAGTAKAGTMLLGASLICRIDAEFDCVQKIPNLVRLLYICANQVRSALTFARFTTSSERKHRHVYRASRPTNYVREGGVGRHADSSFRTRPPCWAQMALD